MSRDLDSALTAHLEEWGLRSFQVDADYFAWQREAIPPADLARLHQCIAAKQASGAGDKEETAFYDAVAHPLLVPILYSQRYGYYRAVGPLVCAQLPFARHVLDFGCGIGILTTFYARQYPAIRFVGIDRSSASITYAAQRARELQLTNVEFLVADVGLESITGPYDVIISTHALLQAERDPGLPSAGWRTFVRDHAPAQQASFEARTGLASRLDYLVRALSSDGRLVIFEKTRLLARRVPFQRALEARGLSLVEPPRPVHYALVEEPTDDGPLYVVHRCRQPCLLVPWNEEPESESCPALNISLLKDRPIRGTDPLYENHTVCAQYIWEALKDRRVMSECTRPMGDGGELHAELGTTQGLLYLYVANTFDQRQIVLMEPARSQILKDYYADIAGPPRPAMRMSIPSPH